MNNRRYAYTLGSIGIAALALTCLGQSSAFAQKTADGWKIGVVDMDGVREGHTWLKEQIGELEKKVEELEAEIKPLRDEIDRMTEEFKAKLSDKESGLSNLDKVRLENEIKERNIAFQNGWEQRQLQIDELVIEVNKEAFKDIQNVIEALAVEENYHLVLRTQNNPRSQVLYFSTAIDITSKVVERLNKLKK